MGSGGAKGIRNSQEVGARAGGNGTGSTHSESGTTALLLQRMCSLAEAERVERGNATHRKNTRRSSEGCRNGRLERGGCAAGGRGRAIWEGREARGDVVSTGTGWLAPSSRLWRPLGHAGLAELAAGRSGGGVGVG